MPARRDLDPVLEIPKVVPWVVLVDVSHNPLDFRFRLIGSGVVDRSRTNYTGKFFSEMSHIGPDSDLWLNRATVVETGTPLRCQPPYVGHAHGVRSVVEIHLPLSDDDTAVNMIFSVVAFHTA